jgi:hypothetical protein
MRRIKVDRERKVFLGIKLDSAMRREIEQGPARQRPAFRAGDPAHLELLEVGEDLFMGRVLDHGLAADGIDDLKRNIRSIVQMTFPGQRAGASLNLFPVEVEDVASPLAAAV